MNSKPMLFECLDCGETYLADNLCDGYSCPKCNGYVIGRGFIKELEENMEGMEERIKVTRDKIIKAKENGLIRKYNKPLYVPCDGYMAELPFDKCMHGVDLGSGKDSTVLTIHVNIDQAKEVEDLIKMFNNFKKVKRAGVIV